MIAVTSSAGMYLVNLDGNNLQPLAEGVFSSLSGGNWSQDGGNIVFVGLTDNPQSQNIYRIDRDGNNLTKLTGSSYVYMSPIWSPGGQWIAYLTSRGEAGSWGYIMESDGDNSWRFDRSEISGMFIDYFAWNPQCP
jgi:Tol biopolymer transport system component